MLSCTSLFCKMVVKMALEIVSHVLLISFLAITAYIFREINRHQPLPYMDEIFHVPQAQNYCHGYYDQWNEKITTLPGLYFSSQLFVTIFSLFRRSDTKDGCETHTLRFTNLIFITGCATILRGIMHTLNRTESGEKTETKKKTNNNKKNPTKKDQQTKILLTSVVLTTFPLLYFFSFLYYTDVGSTFFVLLSYYFSLLNAHTTSAFVGVLAIFFRQTNVVWVGFNMASSILLYLERKNVFEKDSRLLQTIYSAVEGCLSNVLDVISIVLPYCSVFLGFIIFIIKNEGIVVGDRSSHEPSMNVPQLFYFAMFVMIFSSFILCRYLDAKRTWQDIKSNIYPMNVLTCILITLFMLFSVQSFTYVHKYLIADNRHYTFYVWKRVFEGHASMKYVLVPGYFVSWCIMINELRKNNKSAIWILLYLVCTAAVLVPQKLLEFRYFIVPYLMFRLHTRIQNYLEIAVECIVYMSINVATFYLFMHKPFKWTHEDAIQRFMW